MSSTEKGSILNLGTGLKRAESDIISDIGLNILQIPDIRYQTSAKKARQPEQDSQDSIDRTGGQGQNRMAGTGQPGTRQPR
jgi:hypothetical protein